jgi:hypothetical protein
MRAIKSFFLHNRALLSADTSFQLRGDKAAVYEIFITDEIKRVALNANSVCQTLFYVCLLQIWVEESSSTGISMGWIS